MPKIAYYRNCKFRTERRRDRTAPRRAFGALRAPRSSLVLPGVHSHNHGRPREGPVSSKARARARVRVFQEGRGVSIPEECRNEGSGAGTRGLRGRRERKNNWYRWVSDNLPPLSLFFFSAPIAKSQMARPSRSQGVPSRRSASTPS